jgi:hypothetical protein
LKIKVRALPTCKNPVGDGAKRTRGFAVTEEVPTGELDDWFIIGWLGSESLSMVRAAEKCRQAIGAVEDAKYMIILLVRQETLYLNPVVFAAVL